MTWMSPAYPVGAFSYSSGIEWAVEAGDIGSAETLRAWLATMVRQGSVFCDAALFAHAHRAATAGDDKALAAVAELAAALAGSKERFLETTAQGQAFRDITRAAWPTPALDRLAAAWDGPLAYPSSSRRRAPATASRSRPRSMPSCTASCRTSFRPACGSFRSARPTASACLPRSKRRSRRPPRGRARSRSTTSAPCDAARGHRQHAPRDAVHAAVPIVSAQSAFSHSNLTVMPRESGASSNPRTIDATGPRHIC